MRPTRLSDLQPGDRVYRYVWVGGERHDSQPLTVIRRNPKSLTVTVETDQGSRFRLALHDVEGPWPYPKQT